MFAKYSLGCAKSNDMRLNQKILEYQVPSINWSDQVCIHSTAHEALSFHSELVEPQHDRGDQ